MGSIGRRVRVSGAVKYKEPVLQDWFRN